MVKKIIPCLDVHGGKTVKGVNFVDLRQVGDAVELGQKYAREGADELVYLDISATVEERSTFTDLIERLARTIEIPLTVGGGIASVDDAVRLRDAGADKVSINSAAIATPDLIDSLSGRYGSDFVTLAIDGKLDGNGVWRVTTHGGTRVSDKSLYDWAREGESRGAGAVLFTSMDHDGTKKGYPIEVFAQLKDTVKIPIIASGGAGSVADIAEVLTTGRADAALAASIFHFNEIPIPVLKSELRKLGIEVRL